MIRVSFSQYSMWKTCGWMWKLRYVDKLRKFEDSIHSIFGSAMHRVIQEWLKEYLFGGKSATFSNSIDLSDRFKEIFVEEIKPHLKSVDEDGNITFLFSREDAEEFYKHGLLILEYIQKNQKKIFPTKDVELYAIEYEIEQHIRDDIFFVGFVDIVTYNKKTEKYTLYDLKTSSKGWSKFEKSDKNKTDQLLLYKKFFSDQKKLDPENVDIEYVILKRKLIKSDFPNPRVIGFSPSDGKISMNRAHRQFMEFVDSAFDENGEYNPNQKTNPNNKSCRFCPFSESKDLCPDGLIKGKKLNKNQLISLLGA